jgi:hypothetical protein
MLCWNHQRMRASYTHLHLPRSEVGIEAKFVEASLALALNCTLGVSLVAQAIRAMGVVVEVLLLP